MKTVLMENMRIPSKKTVDWVKSFDENYVEINTETNNFMKGDDYNMIALLVNPQLERIVTSSTFQTQMPFEAYEFFGKEFDFEDCAFYQIEYYMFLIFKAMRIRQRFNAPILSIEVNYLGSDFLKDLKNDYLGQDTKMYLKLMLRQQDNVIVNIYNDYKFLYQLKDEENLNLN